MEKLNHPADTPLLKVVAVLKARWACEQVHQQLKNELGLDHFEGRSWRGLHYHVLLTMMAFLFVQFLRLQQAKVDIAHLPGPPPAPSLPALRRQLAVRLIKRRCQCPNCHHRFFLDGS